MPKKCPVCDSDLKKEPETKLYGDMVGTYYSCQRCGDYAMTGTLAATIAHHIAGSVEVVSKISNYIRKMQKAGTEPLLFDDTVKFIKENTSIPNPSEQASSFILWLGDNLSSPGQMIKIHVLAHQSIMGAKTPEGFMLVLKYLFDEGFLEGTIHKTAPVASGTLSMKGWNYYESMKHGAASSRKAFMAMQYGEDILDKVFKECFRPSVKATGYELIRLDESPKAGLIDDKLRVEIRTSRFLISDLTHGNPGAYWEAGFAEGLGKPVIYTCEKGKFESEKTHFDTNHHLTVLWKLSDLRDAAEQLKATIRATLPTEARLTDEGA